MSKFLLLLSLLALFIMGCGETEGILLDGDAELEIESEISELEEEKDLQTDGDLDSDLTENTESEETELEELEPYEFIEFYYMTEEPDPDVRICKEAADPAGAQETMFIDCLIEGESFIEEAPPDKDTLTIMAYNVERGGHADQQIEQILNNDDLAIPDIMLINESDRGCSRSGNKVVIREYARQLKMNYVYAVEFVELSRDGDTLVSDCEHGNGILSKYPLGNVRAIRHKTQDNWYESSDEPRLGGRVAVYADVKIGEKIVHLYSIHFESSVSEETRNAQSLELIEDGKSKPYTIILGGDFNAGFYTLDLEIGTNADQTITPFMENGYYDSHSSLEPGDRTTNTNSGFILDYILSNKDIFSSPVIGAEEEWAGLSDHLPVWVDADITK